MSRHSPSGCGTRPLTAPAACCFRWSSAPAHASRNSKSRAMSEADCAQVRLCMRKCAFLPAFASCTHAWAGCKLVADRFPTYADRPVGFHRWDARQIKTGPAGASTQRSGGQHEKLDVGTGGCRMLVTLATSASAQQTDPQPTCKMCPGYFLPAQEIQAYVKKAI